LFKVFKLVANSGLIQNLTQEGAKNKMFKQAKQIFSRKQEKRKIAKFT